MCSKRFARRAVAEIAALAEGVLRRERRSLAKAITLIESRRADHQAAAQALLEALLPATGRAMRVGISGAPGVGKSTFIEALGLHLIAQGHRVAVLAIDPSSTVSGGSILGDKTRMTRLCLSDDAFIRPSPAAGSLGGVAAKTREAMLLVEAGGFDVVLVETVGVGQSEVEVANMTDLFLLLQLPHAGDELQALKKGIVELADLVVINKADLDPTATAIARAQFENAIGMLRQRSQHWLPPVLSISALKQEGIAQVWQTVVSHRAKMQACGQLQARREAQLLAWFDALVQRQLQARFESRPAVRAAMPALREAVLRGQTTPTMAARQLLALGGEG